MADDYVSPDWANAVLLTIDTQRDFTLRGAPAEIMGTEEIVPSMRRLVGEFRLQNRPIIHVVRIYLPDGSNVDICRRGEIERGKRVVAPESDGAELVDELKPTPETRLDAERLLSGELQRVAPAEWIMYKPRWGAFYQTPLEGHLQELGVDTVVVCGCNFPNCPRATVYEASERDYRVALVADATSGLYERGAQELENIGVKLMDVEEVLKRLRVSALGAP
ncbi:MAG TPA: isochorismatase family cysteine hydrolase [Rubrobacteraceae bacterium]|nr:isochorismatase family cysteine hydrolase [Rubrobacteraceae bacterium]